MEKVKTGLIGLGQRGSSMLTQLLLTMDNCEIVAVCDVYEDLVEHYAGVVESKTGKRPLATTDYNDILASDNVEAVLVMTSWESHVKIACDAMKAGKATGLEVGGGATISLMLDTCNGRPYSRNFTVHGTKGIYREDGNYIYLDTDFGPESHWDWTKNYNNVEAYREKYDHPIWKNYLKNGLRGGHGGMDYLVYNDFFEYVINGGNSPIDVYDAAAWMCITPLSAQSIKEGSRPVEIPDFQKMFK